MGMALEVGEVTGRTHCMYLDISGFDGRSIGKKQVTDRTNCTYAVWTAGQNTLMDQ